jgi:hypothetical protein
MFRNECLLICTQVDMWVLILGNQHLELVGLPNRPIGISQHRFSVNNLTVLRNMWPFINDYTYGSCLAVQHLSKPSSEQRIRRACPVNCLHDLLTSILWGLPKTLVYSAPINDLETLHQGVENVCRDIREEQWIFVRVSFSVWWRAERCTEVQGNLTEHMSIVHIAGGIGFWTMLNGTFCWFKWVLYSLQSISMFWTLCIFTPTGGVAKELQMTTYKETEM